MKLKVGDKLLCKNSLSYEDALYYFEDVAKPLYKDKEYIITGIDTLWYKDSIGVFVEDMEFHIDGDYWMMLWNYFYTPQEIRKIKLEKLDTINYNRQ